MVTCSTGCSSRPCRTKPVQYGGLAIDWMESEVLSSGVQHYKLIDTALGVIQRGTWTVADVVNQRRRAAHGPITLASSGCARRSRD